MTDRGERDTWRMKYFFCHLVSVIKDTKEHSLVDTIDVKKTRVKAAGQLC